MKIAFTICSNNYLAQAKTLGDSLLKYNHEYKFYIVLVDQLSNEINYTLDILHEIITIEEIEIKGFDELWKKYEIIELNTCVKPSIFRYFFEHNRDIEFLFYFDPDIMIYDKLNALESKFRVSDFILTPHIIYPLQISDLRPNEYDFLNYGIYNIGFLGLRNSYQIINDFLPWWEERTLKLGYIKPCIGLFVDQIWFNIVPLFYKKICILNNSGCNVAPWNLHERVLTKFSDKIMVNNKDNLIFFHFSSFKFNTPKTLFYNYKRNLTYINTIIENLYHTYFNFLIENKVEIYSSIKCYYILLKEKYEQEKGKIAEEKKKYEEIKEKKMITTKRWLKKFIMNILPSFFFK